jgi:hypothetical protein
MNVRENARTQRMTKLVTYMQDYQRIFEIGSIWNSNRGIHDISIMHCKLSVAKELRGYRSSKSSHNNGSLLRRMSVRLCVLELHKPLAESSYKRASKHNQLSNKIIQLEVS